MSVDNIDSETIPTLNYDEDIKYPSGGDMVVAEESSTIPEKVIQITVLEGTNLPNVAYQGFNIHEVLGLLEMSSTLVREKTISNKVLQENVKLFLQGLDG